MQSNPLDGKTIVFIGGGGLSKEEHYRSLRSPNRTIILISGEFDQISQDCADLVLICKRLDRHDDDDMVAEAIRTLLGNACVRPDCVLTIWEDCGPLATKVAAMYGLPGNSPFSASVAKSKDLINETLMRAEDHAVRSLALRTARISSMDDLTTALERFSFPAILKLERGSSAAGAKLIETAAIAKQHYLLVASDLKTEEDCPGIGLGFGNTQVISEYAQGTEHDVDLVLFDGTLVAAFVTDNGPTRLPRCEETTAIMPSLLSAHEAETLITSAQKACIELGLYSGVFNLEFIITQQGPKLIDVNARMGGFYIRRWVDRVWGYDLLDAAVRCALGVMPDKMSNNRNHGWIAGGMILPSVYTSWIEQEPNYDRLFNQQPARGEVLTLFDKHSRPRPTIDEPYANLAAWGSSPNSTVRRLEEFWEDWRLSPHEPSYLGYLTHATKDNCGEVAPDE